MGERDKTIESINQKIAAGQAKVLTERETLESFRQGKRLSAADLDVVTVAFRSSLAGSAVMLLVPVAGRGVFTRARRIWLNGVEGFPGPAPNERLGLVDTLIFSGQANRDGSRVYRGADLIEDLLRGNSIEVECLTEEGSVYGNSFCLADLQFARMYTYNSLLPTEKSNHDGEVDGGNSPWDSLRIGDKILLNGAEGIIIGAGTRSGLKNKTLSLAADLFAMDASMLGIGEKSKDSVGHNTIAVPLPILDDSTIEGILRLTVKDPDENKKFEERESEHAISDFMKKEILANRFRLVDSARAIAWNSIE